MTPEEWARHSIHAFLELNHASNDQGIELDWHDHGFMYDIYADWSPQIVGLKAAQVTWSTAFTYKTLFAAKNFGMDIIYSLPTADDVREFVGGKVNRLIANNPILQTWTADKDSIEQKRIGKNNIYYKGTWTERAALMIPADLYVSDETDRSKQETVRQFSTRLQHSKFGWRWYFSNPSAPGVGVDNMWMESDQKHWFLKCDGCNHEQFLTMANIEGNPAIFACTKCHKELNRRRGRWAKKYQAKDISGYWVSLLMCPWVSAEEILKMKSGSHPKYKYSEEQFTNFVLGQPFIGKGNVLSKTLFFQNLVDRVNPQDSRVIIGLDPGIDIRYTVGNKYGLFYYGECKSYADIEKMLLRWPLSILISDGGGDTIALRQLKEKYQGRVWLCYFSADRKDDKLVRWKDDDYTVLADRNKLVQLVVDEFTERRIPIFGTESEWWNFWLHFSHIYRVEEYQESTGITKRTWLRSDRDDWAMATVYWRVGMSRFMDSFAEFINPPVSFGSNGLEVLPEGGTILSTSFKPKFVI